MQTTKYDIGKFILEKIKKEKLFNNVKKSEISFERYPSNKNKNIMENNKKILKKVKKYNGAGINCNKKIRFN